MLCIAVFFFNLLPMHLEVMPLTPKQVATFREEKGCPVWDVLGGTPLMSLDWTRRLPGYAYRGLEGLQLP
jgi:hypothetical protein